MKKSLLFFALLVSFCFLNQAQASYFLVSSQASLDFQRRTHIIVTSKGNDLGRAPQLSAASKAKRIAQAFPEDQILLILTSRNDPQSSEADIQQMGFNHIQYINQVLNPKKLMDEMSRFVQISSFHFYGHSAIPEGLFLDAIGERDVRWYTNDSEAKRLQGHFTEDAFATLNGCNTGYLMASVLSNLWMIPIAGALTGTHFEILYKDQNFYPAEESSKSSWLDLSPKASYRMRPDNVSYNGHYGKYLQGLPFYKFFCVGITDEQCHLGMANSILTSVSSKNLSARSSFEDYADVVREWLCPSGSWGSKLQQNCIKRLKDFSPDSLQNDPTKHFYSPFFGSSLQCNFTSCYSKPVCSTVIGAWDCARTQTPQSNVQSTNFVDEYLDYLKAFQLILH